MTKQLLLKLSMGIILVALIVWGISCAVNPVTGKRELMLLTESDEVTLGKETDEQVTETYGIYKNKELENYINNLGLKLAKVSHRPHLKWSFKVLDTPVLNAFAVPGGYVYFTRQILCYLNNEAELAGVMGHEIGHVTARHTAKRYSQAMLAQLGLSIGAELSETFREYAGIAQFGVSMLFLRFSRDDERQADALGVEYSTKAGYDANYMANFFETLERLHPSNNQGGLLDWFSTHPNPPDRVKAIKRTVQKWRAKVPQQQFKVNRNQYLNKINGLVYGEDPRQGYVERGVFYHPTLKFQFPIPAKWQVNNTPNQVQIFTPEQDAVILLSLTKATSPAAAANKFITESEVIVIKSEPLRVNGLLAQRVTSEISSEQGTISVISYFIQKGNTIFVFHGYSAKEKFGKYLPAFKLTMGQFKHLTDKRKINVKPSRLQIKKTRKPQTLKQALLGFRVPNDKLEEIAILNGMRLEDTIPANTLLKVVVK